MPPVSMFRDSLNYWPFSNDGGQGYKIVQSPNVVRCNYTSAGSLLANRPWIPCLGKSKNSTAILPNPVLIKLQNRLIAGFMTRGAFDPFFNLRVSPHVAAWIVAKYLLYARSSHEVLTLCAYSGRFGEDNRLSFTNILRILFNNLDDIAWKAIYVRILSSHGRTCEAHLFVQRE